MRCVRPAHQGCLDEVLCVLCPSSSSSSYLASFTHPRQWETGHCPTSYDLCRPCLVSGASEAAGHNPSHVFAALKQNVDLQLLKDVTRITTRRPRGLIEWDLYA